MYLLMKGHQPAKMIQNLECSKTRKQLAAGLVDIREDI